MILPEGESVVAVISLLILVGGAVGFLLIVAAFLRWPTLPLYAVTALTAVAWDLPGLHRVTSIGGISINAEDLIVVAALAATIIKPGPLLAVTKRYRLALIVLVLGLGGAVGAGLFQFEPSSVMNEFRAFLFPIAFAAWGLNQDWRSDAGLRKFKTWLTITGVVLALVAVLHTAIYGIGEPDTFVVSVLTGESNTGRPLTSDQAMLLGLVGLLMFSVWGTARPGRDRWLGVVFLVVSIACQHRSVWVAVLIGVALTIIRLRGVALARVVVGAFWLAVLGGIAVLSGAASGVVSSLVASAENTGTLDGRLASWTQLIEGSLANGTWTILFGEPFGFGYDRLEVGRIISYAPHNWYVTVYLRLGLVGLGIFAVILASTFIRLSRRPDAIVAAAAFVSIAVYISAYSLSWLLVAILAWCISESLRELPVPRAGPRTRMTQGDSAALAR